ncbi:3-hydroxybenzoate 4-monooxygenase [Cryobacterium sp. TMT1-21]|uniref:FAD-binding monooxygenase n=1 Tax=unclassified Cryobacterium TaxID=2649013 RepID=UPI00106BCD2D|nr:MULTISPECIES: FAD-binding monooxygenase [unclassified Cryobacterium]TFC88447.1 3-hydroxybenzoate 4-monooxygenase [Cryobacterium sp. TmT2-59]TFD17927.1 3-hydroxybenzoate 4-monooxygenase [Cryobacterium sp. TMT1-21]TFD18922.1 3-hydroxybenzoate 4-monooxygenase [Cryobacterium sp. TMT2-23]TFD20954.1 3-hydroxybenzoate 4-monooxygenase [Cryobacterium sp. TMT4-10]TFD35771.1 3-hydroxybenzoate 4-monooxygenase [Cryobacterium sp. TMT2-10]
MQFHHHGYVSTDPRIQDAAGVGIDRPDELPENVDVLIVGTGPAGMITAAQLSHFPGITTRIVERRGERLAIGQADGIQARSVETFQAFGFAERIIAEAYRITEMAFWTPDPTDASRIVRSARAVDDPAGISEFPHLIVNQARVLDYFAEVMANSPTRMEPDYGFDFRSLVNTDEGDYPVTVTLVHTDGERAGQERIVHARYVVGADGARSAVRDSIGCTLAGDQAFHAWGVMDVLAVTDFPDIRMKCAIQSGTGGNILLIPREGGYLFRMYVDLGEVSADDNGAVRKTTIDEIIAKANAIIHPYTLDVKNVAWHSVYEVAHRLTDRFDDVLPAEVGTRTPRVFITGDACHTHSAKAGQGMNVSMQDGFNLAWKLAYVLEGRSPESLLGTYSAERQVIARNLIDFDKQWSTLMATRPEDLEVPLEDFYTRTAEFPSGFMTEYPPSMLIGAAADQPLAAGFPLGKRFKSASVVRVGDANPVQLGHHHRADGRWRLYAFADAAASGEASALSDWAEWLQTSPESPLILHTPGGTDIDSVFDVKVIYQQDHTGVDIGSVPAAFLPKIGPFELIDYEKVYSTDPEHDIFELRGIDRGGAVVVVRPDQYVANVLPLAETEELAAFFRQVLLVR